MLSIWCLNEEKVSKIGRNNDSIPCSWTPFIESAQNLQHPASTRNSPSERNEIFRTMLGAKRSNLSPASAVGPIKEVCLREACSTKEMRTYLRHVGCSSPHFTLRPLHGLYLSEWHGTTGKWGPEGGSCTSPRNSPTSISTSPFRFWSPRLLWARHATTRGSCPVSRRRLDELGQKGGVEGE